MRKGLALLLIGWVMVHCERQKSNPFSISKGQAVPYTERVFLPAGDFTMGSDSGKDNEKPVHTVFLDGYWIDRYEVTNERYAVFLNDVLRKGLIEVTAEEVKREGKRWFHLASPYCQIPFNGRWFAPFPGKEHYPVYEVTWTGADAFARYYGLRLPTEAEWEKAARGGNQSMGYLYAGSDDLDEVAWHWGNAFNPDNDQYQGRGTHRVGLKKPNEIGCYDMSGNLWEWTQDWYDFHYYEKSPRADPPGAETGEFKVVRGGTWLYHTYYLTCTHRASVNFPYESTDKIGFRCVMDP
jgi:formylglycine-generating enzyme required for sulfatase activity